jgi:hypothetical protein
MKRILLPMLLTVAAMGPVFAWFGASAVRERNAFNAAQEALRTTMHQAAEIEQRRARGSTVSYEQRPDQDLVARLNESLAAAGIPSGSLRNVSAQGVEGPLKDDGVPVYRQTSRVTVGAVTPAVLGRLLLHWRAENPQWTITQIELVHTRSGRDTNEYDVTMLLSALYVE